jgi:hypothetical protein
MQRRLFFLPAFHMTIRPEQVSRHLVRCDSKYSLKAKKNVFSISKKMNTIKRVDNGHPWDSKNWPLFKSVHFSEVGPKKLLSILNNWGSHQLLYIGGRCSEEVINTGLTLYRIVRPVPIVNAILEHFLE